MNEIKSLTSIRGVAAVYVMIFHFYYLEIKYIDSYKTAIRHIINHGHLAVDLFFFLSAFVMCLAYRHKFSNSVSWSEYKNFMIKRFARIYPLYFVFCFIYFFINNKPLITLPINLTLFQIILDQPLYIVDVFWSLSTEWIMYFIFPFLFLLMNRWKNTYINITLLILLPLCLYGLKFVNYIVLKSEGFVNLGFTSIGMARGLVAITRCFIGYLIGITLFNLIVDCDIKKIKKIFHPLILILLIPFLFIQEANYPFLMLYILLIGSCYLYNDKYSLINTGIFYRLGIWSYSIYICHRAVMYGVRNYFNIDGNLANVLAIILSISLSYFTYTYIEQYFNKKLLKALSK